MEDALYRKDVLPGRMVLREDFFFLGGGREMILGEDVFLNSLIQYISCPEVLKVICPELIGYTSFQQIPS